MPDPRRPFVGIALAVLLFAPGCGPSPYQEQEPVDPVRSALTGRTSSFLVAFGGDYLPRDADALVRAAGGTITARYPAVGAVLVVSSASSFAAAMRALPGVDAVGSTRSLRTMLSPVSGQAAARASSSTRGPGEPLAFRQWNMAQIRAPRAHAVSVGRQAVRVGVLDTGIDVTHPDMAGQVNASSSVSCVTGVRDPSPDAWANDFFGHGTHVAGIVAAARNGVGVVGVAPGVQLAALKVVNDDGLIFPEAFVCAVDWAAEKRIDLLNASFTVDPLFFYCSDDPDQLAIIRIIRRAVLRAAARQVTLVAAAGNAFTDLASLRSPSGGRCKVLPVQLPRVIGVSAVGVTRRLAFYSDYGFGAVDLTAPGGDSLIPDPRVSDRASSGQVLSSIPPNSFFYQASADWDGQVQDCSSGTCSTYSYLQGTSQAAPHVAGVAALAVSRFGKISPEALLALLSLTARPVACPPSPYDPGMTGTPATCSGPALYNNFYGAGEVDAFNVVR